MSCELQAHNDSRSCCCPARHTHTPAGLPLTSGTACVLRRVFGNTRTILTSYYLQSILFIFAVCLSDSSTHRQPADCLTRVLSNVNIWLGTENYRWLPTITLNTKQPGHRSKNVYKKPLVAGLRADMHNLQHQRTWFLRHGACATCHHSHHPHFGRLLLMGQKCLIPTSHHLFFVAEFTLLQQNGRWPTAFKSDIILNDCDWHNQINLLLSEYFYVITTMWMFLC